MIIKFILPMLALVSMLFIAIPAQAGSQVNVNTATVEALQAVKGIGPKTAEAIIAYRNKHGSFSEINDLENVKGIGEKKLDKIEDELTVGESDKHKS